MFKKFKLNYDKFEKFLNTDINIQILSEDVEHVDN